MYNRRSKRGDNAIRSIQFVIFGLALLLAASACGDGGGQLASQSTPTTATAASPIELADADPPDGARLDEPPELVRLCFSEPVNPQDGTFQFIFLMPDDHGLGLRIRFRQEGECADIHIGLPDNPPLGQYTLNWQVAAFEGDGEGSGTLYFQIGDADRDPQGPD